jgi:hypothetical protein
MFEFEKLSIFNKAKIKKAFGRIKRFKKINTMPFKI